MGKKNTGLYRDDGLIVLRNMNARGTYKMRKIIIKMFKEVEFQLEIKTNLKKVHFLDVMFNLITGLYTPYKKPNDNLLYINTSSDHPPKIIKQPANFINKRLYEYSGNKQVFNTIKPVYENTLHKSGYKSSRLKYSEEIHQYNSKKRTRNIIWFNPPFCQTVKTKAAKPFFRLLDKDFPQSHSLYKIFNRNTIKVSYSCMNNVSQIIKQRNRNVSNKKQKQTSPCNCSCRNKNVCLLNGNGKVQNVIYKCTVSATQTFKQRVYLGIAERNWKKILYNHRQSFKDKKHKNDTALSSYLWDLKKNHNQIPKFTWSVVRFSPGYSNISKRCLLCLHEKLLILNYHNPAELSNERSKIKNK